MNPADRDQTVVLHHWTARKLQPVFLVGVAAVFLVMMAIAHFVTHSPAAVKALALGAVAFIVPLLPAVTSRIEYRLTDAGLESRRVEKRKSDHEYKVLFGWDHIDCVVPGRFGFKFYKPLPESKRWRRFWMTHVSDKHSGEFHVEAADRERVLSLLRERRIPLARR